MEQLRKKNEKMSEKNKKQEQPFIMCLLIKLSSIFASAKEIERSG